ALIEAGSRGGEDVPRVDADPNRQADPVRRLELPVEGFEPRANVQCGVEGSGRIVFVRRRDPERPDHGVADVLLDGTAPALDDVAQGTRVGTQDAGNALGIATFGDRCRADE